jgi:hypothetical protein
MGQIFTEAPFRRNGSRSNNIPPMTTAARSVIPGLMGSPKAAWYMPLVTALSTKPYLSLQFVPEHLSVSLGAVGPYGTSARVRGLN